MISKPRDYQRSKVYAAERKAFDGSFDVRAYPQLPQVQAYYDKLIKSAWFQRRWSITRVQLADGRGTTIARGGLRGGINTRRAWINLPKWARKESVMLHELAHCCVEWKHSYTQTSWHGREFVKTYVELVTHCMGKEAGDRLKAAFRAGKVKMRGSDEDHFKRVRRRALIAKGVIQPQPVPAGIAAARKVEKLNDGEITAAVRASAYKAIRAKQEALRSLVDEIDQQIELLRKLDG